MLCEFIPPLHTRKGSGIPLTHLQCMHYKEKLHTHTFSFIVIFTYVFIDKWLLSMGFPKFVHFNKFSHLFNKPRERQERKKKEDKWLELSAH